MNTDSAPNAGSAQDSWKSAAADLLSARARLIRIEFAAFFAQSVRRLAWLLIGVGAFVIGWILLLVALVPILADATRIPWPHVALLLAAIHMLIAAISALIIGNKIDSPFPASISEFQKDREWLQNLSKRKS